MALISGGKDSVYNMHQCVQHGHQIVALANMYHVDEQANEEGVEIDSYMYQTVGTNITVAIAEAMQLPLYRRLIKGKPSIVTLEYSSNNSNDEVEDLF